MKKPEPNLFIRHKDKAAHWASGFILSFIVATIVNVYFWDLHDGYWMGLGIGIGVVVGLGKELYDWKAPKGTGWNWWDFAWTVAGGLTPVILLRWGWA